MTAGLWLAKPGASLARVRVCALEQVRAVVVANGWRGVRLERVEDADGVGLGGQLADIPLAYPAEAA